MSLFMVSYSQKAIGRDLGCWNISPLFRLQAKPPKQVHAQFIILR